MESMREAIWAKESDGPRIIASTGNVAFLPLRAALIVGQFNYGQRGILDMTHRRLFTLRSFRRLFEQSGFVVERVIGDPSATADGRKRCIGPSGVPGRFSIGAPPPVALCLSVRRRRPCPTVIGGIAERFPGRGDQDARRRRASQVSRDAGRAKIVHT